MRVAALVGTALLVGLGSLGPARAELKFLVSFAAGGPTDAAARILAPELREQLGTPVIVDNRPGAGGMIGTQLAAAAAPDGNTIVINTLGSQVIAAAMNGKAPYHPSKSFDPIVLLGVGQLVLAVRADYPAKNLKELFALAKDGKMNYGSSGQGTTSHIAGEMVVAESGAHIAHIPYRGSAPSVNDLIAGQIQWVPGDIGGMLGQLQAGQIRGLAVLDGKRSPQIPDVPTAIEQGYPGIDMGNWYGVLAPAGLPPAVHAKLEKAFLTAMAKPEIKQKLAGLGLIGPLNSADFRKVLDKEAERWPPLIEKMGLKEKN